MIEDSADVVRAQRFEVVDAEGRARAALGAGEDGTVSLELLDTEGTTRASLLLETGDGSPRLILAEASGAIRYMITVGPDGPGVAYFNEQQKLSLLLSQSGLGLVDAHGAVRASIAIQDDGSAEVRIFDARRELVNRIY